MNDDKQERQRKNPPGRDERADDRHTTPSAGSQPAEVQGEGNYDAAREYNADQQQFVQSGKVEAAARAARPATEAERAELHEAELKGKERAKR